MTAVAAATTVSRDHDGHLPGSGEYRRVSWALFIAGLATFALLYSTQALLPELATHFRVSTGASTLTVSLTTLGLGVALLVAGPASDRFGRTRFIHVSLVASTVAAALCAVAPSWHALLTLRLVEGVALAGLPAVATAYLREELHPSSHARAAGVYVGGTALGGMAGRLVTGSVAELGGWRWALAATALLGLACAVGVRLLLPRSGGFVPTPTGVGTLLSSARGALSDPVLVVLYVVGACSVGSLVAVFNTLGFRLEGEPYGLGLAAASLVYLVYPLGSVSSILFGRLADARGRRAVLPLGCAIAVGGALLTLAAPLAVVVTGVALLTAGFFAVHGVASGWVPARAHARAVPSGMAASLYLCAYYMGSSLFGSIGGHAWTVAAWPGVVAVAAVLLVVTAVLALGLRRTQSMLA